MTLSDQAVMAAGLIHGLLDRRRQQDGGTDTVGDVRVLTDTGVMEAELFGRWVRITVEDLA